MPPEVLPSVILSQYQVAKTPATGNPKNRQAVAEFQGQTMNQTDVDAFFTKYVSGAKPNASKVYQFHGEPKRGGDLYDTQRG